MTADNAVIVNGKKAFVRQQIYKTITTYSGCVKVPLWAWVNNACSPFTRCSDYSGSTNATCYDQGSGCNYMNFLKTSSAWSDNKTMSSTLLAPCYYFKTQSPCLAAGMRCFMSGNTYRYTIV